MLINQKVLGYTLDDNVHIRISGDGRNVGKKIKHVMITFAIMNNKNAIFLPDHHYSLVLYSGIEKYEYLQKALHQLIEELDDIDKNGFIDSIGQKWRITIYFSSDWKFLSICLGINNATANHFCPWCLCSKFDHSKLEKEWKISKKMEIIKVNYQAYPGHKLQPLFPMIPLTHWIPDELHLMLRITDRLWVLMLPETNYQNSKNWSYTSLMGEDKLKVLKNFNLESVLPENRSTIIHQLWNGFDNLYTALQDPTTNPIVFKNQAKSLLTKFLTPSIGDPHRRNYVKGLYTNNDVTPYIHVLVHHMYEFMTIHNNYGVKAFTCNPVEKKNHMQISKYFRKTLKDGRKGRKKAVIEILEHENCLLYYNYNNIPTISKNIRKIKIN
ncbi:7216_t:CDS:2 [Entrophospora sp. SA101]|nr:7216_t:CDS:2 [Entrophospora sp. SA101]